MSENKPKNNFSEVLKLLSLVSHIGILIIVSIGLPLLLGVWADKTFNTKGIAVVIGVLIGIAAAVRNVYALAQDLLKPYDKK